MATETESNRGRIFVGAIWPWLLGAGMFALYFATLYRQATPWSIDRLANLSGWNWRPQLFSPVTFLATYPLRWVPDGSRLLALNLFAAGCAALTLVLLARSVTLLPHDRTNEQRQREQGAYALLSIRVAWLAPLFAVLMCGLQMTFWERATQFVDTSQYDNGEILNLLLFAYVVRCLLEYRVSQKESWMFKGALVYGLSMANNWAMIGFFPVYLAAVIWIKGFEIFHWRFVLRMLVWGLIGLCILFFLPLLTSREGYHGLGFKDGLLAVLGTDKNSLTHFDRKSLLLVSASLLLPVFLIGIRWADSFGDNSRMGIFLARAVLSLAHGFFLLGCLWMAMDPPFGPRQLSGLPFLTYFYLGSLAVGYFAGYFLLVFGSKPAQRSQRTPTLEKWLNRAIVVAVWLLAMGAPMWLLSRNLPRIETGHRVAEALQTYFSKIVQSFTNRGAVVLSDTPALLFQLQAVQAAEGTRASDMYVETDSLSQYHEYSGYLDKRFPEEGIADNFKDQTEERAADVYCIALMEKLSAKRDLYYLHPSFGYYFERFYPEPHGVDYRLQICPTTSWRMPAMPRSVIEENRAFWLDMSNELAQVQKMLEPVKQRAATNGWERFARRAFFASESDQVAAQLAGLYSRALNEWGVDLRRSQPRDDTAIRAEAGHFFELAKKLNPYNGPASVNLDYNREGKPFSSFADNLPGNYRYWYQHITVGGPFDEPVFSQAFGVLMRAGSNFRQAVQQFQRVEELETNNLAAALLLCQTMLMVPKRSTAVSAIYPPAYECFSEATTWANRACEIAPNDTNALYMKTLSWLELGGYTQAASNSIELLSPSAGEAYSNCLAAADRLLTLVPDEPNTLYFKGTALMELSRYREALRPFSRLIETQTNATSVFFSRAVANYQLGELDAAKGDYSVVVRADPKAYKAYFGLGEIAYKEKDMPGAVQNYRLYLTNAPEVWRNSDEYKRIQTRVQELNAGQN